MNISTFINTVKTVQNVQELLHIKDYVIEIHIDHGDGQLDIRINGIAMNISKDDYDLHEQLVNDFLMNLNKFDHLNKLQYDSCNDIIIKNLPTSIQTVVVGHPNFNPDLFDSLQRMGAQLFIANCCHVTTEYCEITTEFPGRRAPLADTNCLYCRYRDKLQCSKCGRCDNVFEDLIRNYLQGKGLFGVTTILVGTNEYDLHMYKSPVCKCGAISSL